MFLIYIFLNLSEIESKIRSKVTHKKHVQFILKKQFDVDISNLILVELHSIHLIGVVGFLIPTCCKNHCLL